MKRLYALASLLALTPLFTFSQDCSNGRYGDAVFSDVMLTSDIMYGNNINLGGVPEDLMLDIYEPDGDTDPARPLVIIAHGGSFVGGSKDGVDVVPIAEDLAKRGYVVASISYRLGIENLLLGPDSTDGAEAVIRGTHDGKAAVRFFRKDVAENGNTYRIDENHIYFGGVSAGGFIALNVAYFDKDSEMPSYVDTTKPNVDATAEGSSGNDGYSSEVNAIFNIAGAIADTNWIEAGDISVLSMHGNNDGTVPYATDLILVLGNPMLEVDGSASVHERADNVGLANCFKTHEGADHVPHVADPLYYDTLRNYVGNYLYSDVCGFAQAFCNETQFVSTPEYKDIDATLALYPNPAEDQVTISTGLNVGEAFDLRITDLSGRVVSAHNQWSGPTVQIDRNSLPSGTYLVELESGTTRKVGRVVFR